MNAFKWSSWTEFEKSLKSKGANRTKGKKLARDLRQGTARHTWQDLLSSMVEPAKEEFLLVVCERCQKVICPSVLIVHTDTCTVHPSGSIGEEPSVSGKGKSANKKIKDYCPDTHCGVWIDRDNRQCVKSLTCKDHTLSERRLVKGRTKPFDELLKQHQEKMRKKGKSTKTATSTSNTETREQPTEEDRSLDHHHLGNWPSSDEEAGESAVEMPSIGPSPSPLSFNTFGLRKTSSFGILSHHRGNPLLSAARALIGPLSTSGSASKAHLTTEHRKHLYSSLPEEVSRVDTFYSPRPCVHSTVSSPQMPKPVKPVVPVDKTKSSGVLCSETPVTSVHERPNTLFPLHLGSLRTTSHDEDPIISPSSRTHSIDVSTSLLDTSANISSDVTDQLGTPPQPNICRGNSWIAHGTEHAQTDNGSDDLSSTGAGREDTRHSVYPQFELAREYPASLGTVVLNGMHQQYTGRFYNPAPQIGLNPYLPGLLPNGQPFLMPNSSLSPAHLMNSAHHQQIPYIHPHSVLVPQGNNSKLKDAPNTKQSPPSKRRRVSSHHGKPTEDITHSHLLSKDLSTDYTRHSVVQEHQHVT